MEQIILTDKKNSTIQFSFMDMDKMQLNKTKSENREFALNILSIIMVCSLTLLSASLLLLAISYNTMDKGAYSDFSNVIGGFISITLITYVIDAFIFAIFKTGGTNYEGVYNDIVTLYDYIYKDDFSNITFSILEDDNNIRFEHSSYTYLDFPMTFKTTQITKDKDLDVDYAIDFGIFRDTYFCNVIRKSGENI